MSLKRIGTAFALGTSAQWVVVFIQMLPLEVFTNQSSVHQEPRRPLPRSDPWLHGVYGSKPLLCHSGADVLTERGPAAVIRPFSA